MERDKQRERETHTEASHTLVSEIKGQTLKHTVERDDRPFSFFVKKKRLYAREKCRMCTLEQTTTLMKRRKRREIPGASANDFQINNTHTNTVCVQSLLLKINCDTKKMKNKQRLI